MEPLWTDVAQVVIVAAQLVVLIAAAIFARHQVKEARDLREAQTRPFVVIDFQAGQNLIFLTISNVGQTMARDVRFEFDPPLSSTVEPPVPFGELKVFREGIPTLPPAKVIRTLFDSGIQRTKAELPDEYKVRITYADHTSRRNYADDFRLDLGIYWNLLHVDQKDLEDVHNRLKDIRDTLRKWTTSTGGILRLSPSELETEIERRAKAREERDRRFSGPAE